VTSIKIGDIDFDAFPILSIEIGWVIGVVTSIISRWGLIIFGFHSGQPFVKCLKGF